MKSITIYDVFELNRVLHNILKQQTSYPIRIAFTIHTLVKWLDDTESFIMDRIHMLFGNINNMTEDPSYSMFLSAQIPFIETDLSVEDLLNTEGDVIVDIEDVEILKKMLHKSED